MLPLQVPGGPELLVIFLLYAVVGLLPVVAAVVGIYLLYKIRGDIERIADALEELDSL
ncbi:hypothetical protein [Haloferax larsenii]|uniref:Uncharacterized protein n=1 Tax=Haloferax larsenii TaxID=302484 RepID=A0A1H7GNK0_HALLR|nr:hypothetical protein [Haloferax larsenii]SEK39649.1 hypothetical protein SAMN04488691_101354 [Haloferax larsenii]